MFYIGTSFKMNKLRADIVAYADILRAAALPRPPEAQLFIIPPFTGIETLARAANGLPVWFGAQNCGPAASGAFTGEVSAAMLADLGCNIVEIGHSERRTLFSETDEAVNRKTRLILDHGMVPLICLGESAAQKKAGETEPFILQQARAALAGLTAADRSRCLFAYEPIWAIGTGGIPATPADIAPVHRMLKHEFAQVPVLYGGSVDEANAADLARKAFVDGLFIGRAALDAAGFLRIAARALAAR
jgi:triosephosphate isomerase